MIKNTPHISKKPQELDIKNLLSKEEYLIPIYQRNFSWGEAEILQLIQDIYDSSNQDQDRNYYLGTLVVDKRWDEDKTTFETIDGQQRLTTLLLIAIYLKKEKKADIISDINLSFESRPKATSTLMTLLSNQPINEPEKLNTEILNGYKIIKDNFSKIVNADKNNFANYFQEKVRLLRVEVPEETDLNHYFEIMNTRGEQLEKHEILKWRLLRIIQESDENKKNELKQTFNQIWEACANMNQYVQLGFLSEVRSKIFDDNWEELKVAIFEDIMHNLEKHGECGNALSEKQIDSNLHKNSHSIEDILLGKTFKEEIKEDNEDHPNLNSVINFPNFLLHVLRIQKKEELQRDLKESEDIDLDDKRLLDTFYNHINLQENKLLFVKIFSFNLLKLRFLFDKYIIKSKHSHAYGKEAESWSLQKIHKYESSFNLIYTFSHNDGNTSNNKKLMMLLSMFHVSAPTLIYKHWLTAVLYFLYKEYDNIKPEDYADYLENLAKDYLNKRYIIKNPKSFTDIVFRQLSEGIIEEDFSVFLHNGTSVENFIFNYLDYLIWRDKKEIFQDFRFTFKSTVEHFYPQHPNDINNKLKPEILNNFGNLCLMAKGKNSRFTNNMPKAKAENFKLDLKTDSPKFFLMYNTAKEKDWKVEDIKAHGEDMIETLKSGKYDSN